LKACGRQNLKLWINDSHKRLKTIEISMNEIMTIFQKHFGQPLILRINEFVEVLHNMITKLNKLRPKTST